jgi:DNA processing protein
VTEQQAWLALNAAELPPRTALELLEHFGSAPAVLAADPQHLAAAVRLRPAEAARLARARAADYGPGLERLSRLGARLITIRDDEYPPNLRHIYDPPAVLFACGSLQPADERAVAIVGTRRVTPYGRVATETLARDLARQGVTVVSGLAVGADAAAHRGALAAGGRTIGVLACGLDVPYPRDTMELRARIVEQGAVISELPLGTPAQRTRFHARNRLLSGLSLGVIVTEAPERSGALITANAAAAQGRQVFAVPGSINSEFSRGTHALLRDGARLVESVDDVMDELSLPEAAPPKRPIAPPPAAPAPPPPDLTGDEQVIIEALSLQQRHIDDIIEHCRVPSSRASASLLMLELKGLVRRLPGNMFMRVR